MAGEDGIGEVVETLRATPALIALSVGLGVIAAVLDDGVRGARRAGNAIGPAHVADRLVALGVVDKFLDIHHRSTPREPDQRVSRADEGWTNRTEYNDLEGHPGHHPGIHLEPVLIGDLLFL